jgi:UDP-4-amino-4,6-dideoxy-N-acetyl-beta-L-altrosamine N-acetyltransferase
MKIATDRLRPMSSADLATVLHWRNHPDVRQYMFDQHEIGLDEHRQWFERQSSDPGRALLIYEAGGVPSGFVALTRGRRNPLVADWGFYAAPGAPKGTGRALGVLALSHAFGSMALHKVCGQAIASNRRSIDLHLALGFRQEGLLRDQHFDGRHHHAVVCFGLLVHEWPARSRT